MCGILRLGSFGSMARTSPAIQSSPSVDLELQPARRHQLHADADAEERPALDAHRSSSASRMPGTASRPRLQSAKAPTPGSTIRSAAETISGSAVSGDHRVGLALACGALEGLGRRVQVTRAVVDDGDALHVRRSPCEQAAPARDGVLRPAPSAVCVHVPAVRDGRARIGGGVRRDLGMRRQPDLEEAALAVLAVAPGDGPDETPTAALQRGAVERAGFEAEHDLGRSAPARCRGSAAPSALSAHTTKPTAPTIDGELEPHALPQQPQRRHQRGEPREAVLDEDELLGAIEAIGRHVRRLMHGIDDQRRSSQPK